jgi:lipopolysaccharide/colanic/teichoic acid biosynthesis glycosyltransferase
MRICDGIRQLSYHAEPRTNMALDLENIENWSLWLDLRVVLRTVAVVLRGEGR